MTNDQTVTQAALEAFAQDIFKHGHSEGWTGNQTRRDVQHVDADKGWSLYVSNGALAKTLARHRTAHSGEGREDVDYWNEVAQRLGHESVCEALEKLAELQDAGEGRSNGAIEAAFREGHARGCIDGSGFEDRDWQRSVARKGLISTLSSNGAGEIEAGLVERFRSALRFAASRSVISSADEQALLAALSAPQGEVERLRKALAKRTFLTCVSGDGPTPYLKVHFNNLADAHAAQDELLGRKS